MAPGLAQTARTWCLTGALVLALTACGAKSPGATPTKIGGGITTVAGTPTTNAAKTVTAAEPGTAGGTPRTPSRTGASAVTAKPPTAAANNDAIAQAASRAPGGFAGVVLAAGPASAIVLDVRVEPGASAAPNVITRMAQILREQSAKPVTVHGPAPLSDNATTHSADDIRRLASTQGDKGGNGVAVIHLFYFGGSYEQDGVLGVTVRGDTTAIFSDAIDSATTPLVSHVRIEEAVVTHEVGHVLGLVDLFLNDNRDDATHPGHSTNRNSVMYFAVESDLVTQVLGGPPPVDFDGADLGDLRRIHGGAAPGS